MNTIVSPHLDDAVLSLGQYMAAEAVRVVTMFAGVPALAAGVSPYDEARGFESSCEAVLARRIEDEAALARLGSVATHLCFLDHQYRDLAFDDPELEIDLERALRGWKNEREHLFVPVGIGHPDHELVARVARRTLRGTLLLYEELPYRVLNPEEVWQSLAAWRADGWQLEDVWPLPQGDRERKERAIGRYRSQFPAGADDPCLLVPERVWRAYR